MVEVVQGRLMWGLVIGNVHPVCSVVIGVVRVVVVLGLHGG